MPVVWFRREPWHIAGLLGSAANESETRTVRDFPYARFPRAGGINDDGEDGRRR